MKALTNFKFEKLQYAYRTLLLYRTLWTNMELNGRMDTRSLKGCL